MKSTKQWRDPSGWYEENVPEGSKGAEKSRTAIRRLLIAQAREDGGLETTLMEEVNTFKM